MRAVRRMAYLSIATSMGTIVLKFGAYLMTGSVSLWSDALESLVNLAAGLVALGALPPAELKHAAALIRAALPEGTSFHALRTRKSGARRFVEFHLLVPGTMSVVDSHSLCDRIEASLMANLAKMHVTIHVEPLEEQAPHT